MSSQRSLLLACFPLEYPPGPSYRVGDRLTRRQLIKVHMSLILVANLLVVSARMAPGTGLGGKGVGVGYLLVHTVVLPQGKGSWLPFLGIPC